MAEKNQLCPLMKLQILRQGFLVLLNHINLHSSVQAFIDMLRFLSSKFSRSSQQKLVAGGYIRLSISELPQGLGEQFAFLFECFLRQHLTMGLQQSAHGIFPRYQGKACAWRGRRVFQVQPFLYRSVLEKSFSLSCD